VNAASHDVQRRIQGERSMPVVFESVTLRAAGRMRQYQIQPIQRLNGSLIDTEHGSMLGGLGTAQQCRPLWLRNSASLAM
jgi:hypothetical protein